MGAACLFGVQVLTGVIQLGYAAFTSGHTPSNGATPGLPPEP